MNRPMSIQIPTAIVLFLGITAPSMVTAESPYLLLKFTESYRDISVIGRRFATFRELNGMNTCKINYWPHRTDETNAARIGAILSDALEKEKQQSPDGLRWQKPKTEIISSA